MIQLKIPRLKYREGNGTPLQYSCLENPRGRGVWWAAVYGVAQSWTRLKPLSSSSSSEILEHQEEADRPRPGCWSLGVSGLLAGGEQLIRLTSGSWRCGGRNEKCFYKKMNRGGKVVDSFNAITVQPEGPFGVFEDQGIYEFM